MTLFLYADDWILEGEQRLINKGSMCVDGRV